MKKSKKLTVSIVSVVIVLGVVLCLIATNNRMLLRPDMMISNYKSCQKSNSGIYMDFTDNSSPKDIIMTYIGGDDAYDFYIYSLYDGRSVEIEEDYIVKKKGDKIVAAFNLKKLNLPKRDGGYISCGFYNKGYLYFTIEGANSIFCIDDCLNDCRVYFTPQKFGRINAVSLCVADGVYYITDSGSLVKYDGSKEAQIKKLPEIPSAFEEEKHESKLAEILKEQGYMIDDEPTATRSKYSYCLNCIDGEFYFGMENKLFCVDKNGNAEYLEFKIPSSSSEESHIYRIEPYKSNSNIIAVSFFFADVNSEGRSSGTFRYLINPENGDTVKCKQRAGNYTRCLSESDFWDYFDNIRSMAGTGE